MLTAPAKQRQEQYDIPTAETKPKIKEKKRNKNCYGFHKFCGLVIACGFILGLLLLAQHALVMSKGYKIIAMKKEIAALKTSNERLQLKTAQLKDLKRVEMLAVTQLGMMKPSDAEKEFMDIKPEPIEVAKAPEIIVEPKPDKTINPVVDALNDIVKVWVSQASTQINPKG